MDYFLDVLQCISDYVLYSVLSIYNTVMPLVRFFRM